MEPVPGLNAYRMNFGGMTWAECRRFSPNLMTFVVVLVLKLIRKVGPLGVYPGRLVEAPCTLEDFPPIVSGVLTRQAAMLEAAGFRRWVVTRLSLSMPGAAPDGGMLRALHDDGMRVAFVGIVPSADLPSDFDGLMKRASVTVECVLEQGPSVAVTRESGFDPAPGSRLVLLRDAPLSTLLERLDAEIRKAGRPRRFASLDDFERHSADRDALADADRVRRGLYGKVSESDTRAYFAQCRPR